MKTETKLLAFFFLAILALILGGVFFLSKNQNSPSPDSNKVYQIDYSKGERIGSDSAKIKLVEFSDYECPACALFAPTVAQLIASDSANLQVYYRNFPLPQHSLAKKAAVLAEEANAEGKFWPVHDKLFAAQDQWASLSEATDFFVNLAKEEGMDEIKTKEALENNLYQDKIQADINEGMSLGVDATPTFFLNGKKLNLASPDDLKNIVNQMLNN